MVVTRPHEAESLRVGPDPDLLLQCAGFNGKPGSSFGQLFHTVDPASDLAMAA